MLEGTLEGNENVLKLEQTDRCTILQIYQVTELYTYNEGIYDMKITIEIQES